MNTTIGQESILLIYFIEKKMMP